MKESYSLPNRYGYQNKLVQVSGNLYRLVLAEDWMTFRAIYKDSKREELIAIDPDGGPFLTEGWTDGKITVVGIKDNSLLELKEND